MAGIFRCPACGGFNRVDAGRHGPKCGRCKASLPTDGAPVSTSDDQLEELIRTSPVPVLVDFYADWCQPCRMLSPVLAELGHKHAGRLVVAKVDTERHPRVASSLRVEGIPAVFLYRGGRV
ncbi:MAG: thioredoxin domain-containing protein, partial [Myxococcota bacterium]